MTKQQIEDEYNNLLNKYKKTYKRSKKTQKECVLQYLQEHPNKIWFFAWEVVNKKTKSGDFLSHRAPARLTDLVDDGICVSRVLGDYTVYRLK